MKEVMIIIGGELVINIKQVYSDPSFVRPKDLDFYAGSKYCNDLSILDKDGSTLHICGDNDWGFLALELLKQIKIEAKRILEEILEEKRKVKVAAVMLGRNDKRILDIYFGGKDTCKMIYGIPVIETENLNEIKYLTAYNDLPF